MTPHDIRVHLPDRPGALADFGETLGKAGVSLLGGGVFTHNHQAIAHFLVDDAAAASTALTAVGHSVAVGEVVMLRLDQATPGQLGTVARLFADGGVNIAVQYSDHDHSLVLVVSADQLAAARGIARRWSESS